MASGLERELVGEEGETVRTEPNSIIIKLDYL